MENYKIDKFGNPYIENESFPCGGGLDKRCSYNDIALKAYYDIIDKNSVREFFKENGFGNPIHEDSFIAIYEKGDTKIYLEGTDVDSGYAYLTTEYIG